MLGTRETIIAEVQIITLMDKLWDEASEMHFTWEDFKQMFDNYFEEREYDRYSE